jgi:hypothetical protein
VSAQEARDRLAAHAAELLTEWRRTCKAMGLRWTDLDAGAFVVDGLRLADRLDQAAADRAALERVRALHPKIEKPRHGCCAPPKLCKGHAPECGGREHSLSRPPWPCPTIAALDGPDAHGSGGGGTDG